VKGAGALTLAVLAALQAAPAAAQAAPPPGATSCSAPEYPREAVRYELEGITTLRFHLAPDGRVAGVQVASSSGWALLDEASIRTLRSCRFAPEQAARARGAALPVQYVWNLDGEANLRPHLVPGSCQASGRFAAFKPYDNAPSGPDGVKVRLLVDPAGQPRGVKIEGATLQPAMADALVRYVESCRFGFDPELKGQRTDTVYGRVVFARQGTAQ
jgi:TonB family protein